MYSLILYSSVKVQGTCPRHLSGSLAHSQLTWRSCDWCLPTWTVARTIPILLKKGEPSSLLPAVPLQ